jgi:transcription initiation factor TFIID subunit TAF12
MSVTWKSIAFGVAIAVIGFPALAARTYTPEELRGMVGSGKYPSQGSPTSQSQASSFSACVDKAQSVSTSVQPEYPVKVIVNTNILYTVKFWTNDAAMTVSCSAPDGKIVVTTAPYN